MPKNYNLEYKINNYNITEKFNKKNKLYTIKINSKKNTFEFYAKNKYVSKRKIISNVEEYKSDNTKCLVVKSDIIKNNILCLKEDKYIDYHLTSNILPKKYYKDIKSTKKNYQNIKINYLDDMNYYVWNYKGFVNINSFNNSKANVFDKDIYNLDLSYSYKNFILIADYSEEYEFNKFILLNTKNNKKSEIKSKVNISFDSEFLGTYKNSIYLIDKKNEVQYEINIKKKKITKVSKNNEGKIYDNAWKTYSIKTIISDNIKFSDSDVYDYQILEDKHLYKKIDDTLVKISEKDISCIVKKNDDSVYYISEDKLYKYSFEYGEIEILNYFELYFNYEKMIFIV